MNKNLIVALALTFASTAAMAEEFGNFIATSSVDDFTDEKTIMVFARGAKEGMYHANYAMSCKPDGGVRHTLFMTGYLTGGDALLTKTIIRFDKGEVWKGESYAVNSLIVLLPDTPLPDDAERLVVQVEDYSGDKVKSNFSIKGFGEALKWITEECK